MDMWGILGSWSSWASSVDPPGLTKDGDAKQFVRFCASEIKRGRVAMTAAMGFIVPEYGRFLGDLSTSEAVRFEGIPNDFAALSKLPALGGLRWILFAHALEFGIFFSTRGRGQQVRHPSVLSSTSWASSSPCTWRRAPAPAFVCFPCSASWTDCGHSSSQPRGGVF